MTSTKRATSVVTALLAAISAVAGAGAAWIVLRNRSTRASIVAPGRRRAGTRRRARAAARPGGVPTRHPCTSGREEGPTWASVVDKLNLGVVVMGRNGDVRYRNQKAKSMAGTHTGLLIDDAVESALRTRSGRRGLAPDARAVRPAAGGGRGRRRAAARRVGGRHDRGRQRPAPRRCGTHRLRRQHQP